MVPLCSIADNAEEHSVPTESERSLIAMASIRRWFSRMSCTPEHGAPSSSVTCLLTLPFGEWTS